MKCRFTSARVRILLIADLLVGVGAIYRDRRTTGGCSARSTLLVEQLVAAEGCVGWDQCQPRDDSKRSGGSGVSPPLRAASVFWAPLAALYAVTMGASSVGEAPCMITRSAP